MFTLNHPSSRDEAEFPKLIEHAQYLCYQQERGDDTNTKHYQGYVCFRTNKRLNAVRRFLTRAHWEVRRGTHQQAKDYCTKVDTRYKERGPYEYGEEPIPEQGARNDLVHLKARADQGATPLELYEEFFGSMCRYGRGVREYLALRASVIKRQMPKTYVFYGETGLGKTFSADNFLESVEADYYVLERSTSGVWWDGYYGQRAVFIDEYYGWIPWSSFSDI